MRCRSVSQPTFRFTCQLSSVTWSFTAHCWRTLRGHSFSLCHCLLYRSESEQSKAGVEHQEDRRRRVCSMPAKVAIRLCKSAALSFCSRVITVTSGTVAPMHLVRHYRCTTCSTHTHSFCTAVSGCSLECEEHVRQSSISSLQSLNWHTHRQT